MVEYENVSTGDLYSYQYDALGRRTAKVVTPFGVASQETRFVYWSFHCLEERGAAEAVTATYVYGARTDEVLSMQRSGGDYYFHSDELGNVMRITDAVGAVVEQYDYTDYGVVLDPTNGFQVHAGSTIGNPLLFQGRRLDAETGLYCFRYRYLEPETGRFTVRDPIGIWGDGGNFGNGYAFAGNNPWSFVDPYGLAGKKVGKALKTAGWFLYGVVHGVANGFSMGLGGGVPSLSRGGR